MAMHSVQAPLSGNASPMGATAMHHDSMAQQQYQQHAYESAREAAAQAVASTSRHLLPTTQMAKERSNSSIGSANSRGWQDTQRSSPGISGSSTSASPLRMQIQGSTSPLRVLQAPSPSSSNSASKSSAAVQMAMPTTAASLMREGPRDFTVIKDVGDGSFGTVCLADWRSPLPSGTLLSPMQHPTTRPEYLGKRLVAIKKMKKPFPSWEECLKLKELKCLLAMPHHPNIIPLYDAFLMPVSKELHFVFECMEGNLYQLTKSRRGRPLAAGLVASIFQQIVKGLHHIHDQGYFHRDMKPENLLITTTGLADYPPPSSLTSPDSTPEKDVLVIVKLADFGLARETDSKPPYTEYVSTRWYRAPEVLLRSRDYSNPVDMWALGTIMAELITLKPLFPGQTEIDQVMQICEVLGDPSRDHGNDSRGRLKGGGEWNGGINMAKSVGFTFPSMPPILFSSLFSSKVPESLIDCVQDMIRYDPNRRLTTVQCLQHPYYTHIAPRLQPAQAKAVVSATTPEQQAVHARIVPKTQQISSIGSVMDQQAQRSNLPPSHSLISIKKPAFGENKANTDDGDVSMGLASPLGAREASLSGDAAWAAGLNREGGSISQYPSYPDSASVYSGNDSSAMQMDYGVYPSMQSPSYDPVRMASGELEMLHEYDAQRIQQGNQVNYDHGHSVYRTGRPSNNSSTQYTPGLTPSGDTEGSRSTEALSFKDKERGRGKGWGFLGGIPADKQQPPSQPPQVEMYNNEQISNGLPAPTPAQRLAAEHADRKSPVPPVQMTPAEAKKAKKLAEKAAREAEKSKRAAQEKAARERARAVMQKRNQILASSNTRDQVEWLSQADNETAKAALLPASGTPAAHLYPNDGISRGKQPSMLPTANSDPTLAYAPHHQQSIGSPYSAYSGQSSNLNSPAWPPGRSSSRGNLRKRDYEEDNVMNPYYPQQQQFPSRNTNPRRQSMQSFQTGDSDPGPGRTIYVAGSSLHSMQRQDSASSLNSAPGMIDGASISSRIRYDDRHSLDTRSIASSLDHQLIQNMENMTAVERSMLRGRTGSTSPGPVHLIGQRSSVSRQSHGSRASSAHRQGSASPLHHTSAPRFHPYGVGGPGGNSNSYTLPSLASVAQSSASMDAVGNISRPKSLNRRSSLSHHRGVASRGSVASGESLPPIPQGSGMSLASPINPMFHVHPDSPGSTILSAFSSPGQQHQTLPPFSQLAAAAASSTFSQSQDGGSSNAHSDEYHRERSQL